MRSAVDNSSIDYLYLGVAFIATKHPTPNELVLSWCHHDESYYSFETAAAPRQGSNWTTCLPCSGARRHLSIFGRGSLLHTDLLDALGLSSWPCTLELKILWPVAGWPMVAAGCSSNDVQTGGVSPSKWLQLSLPWKLPQVLSSGFVGFRQAMPGRLLAVGPRVS